MTRSIRFTFLCTSPTSTIQQIFVANVGNFFTTFKIAKFLQNVFATMLQGSRKTGKAWNVPICAEISSIIVGISHIFQNFFQHDTENLKKIFGFFQFGLLKPFKIKLRDERSDAISKYKLGCSIPQLRKTIQPSVILEA